MFSVFIFMRATYKCTIRGQDLGKYLLITVSTSELAIISLVREMNYFPNKMKVKFTRDAVLCIIPIGLHVLQGGNRVDMLPRTHDTHKVKW